MSNFLNKSIHFGLITCFFIAFNAVELQAQKTKIEYKKNGDSYFDKGDYVEASANYLKILKLDSNDFPSAYKYALSEYNQRNYATAKKWFVKIIDNDELYDHNLALFYLAMTEKSLEEYDEAKEHLTQLIELTLKYPLPPFIQNQLEFELNSMQFAIDNKNQKRKIEIKHLPPPINSPYSEFNPIPIGTSSLYFSRYKPIFDNDTVESMFTQVYSTEIVSSTEDKNGWQNPVSLGSKVNNPKYHNANLSLNHAKTKAYFSRCIDLDGKVGDCKIYSADIEFGKMKNIKPLPNSINASNCTNTQAFFVETNTLKLLYFVSNREGGYGGMDIWYSLFVNGSFQEPINLGSTINTALDELCPSYSNENSRLYFSSNGHHGFGGFDIFKSNGGLNEWSPVENMKMPINSAANDLYFYPVKKNNQAYFVSNRAGSFHLKDAEFCCTDIYLIEFGTDTFEIPIVTSILPTADSTEKIIQDLLPLSLYFHNDEPNPKSLQTTSDRNYKDLLAEYILLKPTYIKEYSAGLSTTKAEKAKAEIEQFFIDSVESGFENLEKLRFLLKDELLAGKSVNIKIKGYASPLNTPAYNLNLSKRRISSVKNYLLECDSGFFKPYFGGNASNGAKLNLYEDAFGDIQSRNTVSDNPNDKRNSVYSRAAAEQRRIQIVRYSSFYDSISVKENFGFPELQWLNTNFKFDKISSKQNFTQVISIKNVGEAVLNIQSFDVSNELLKLEISQKNLQPKEEAEVYILFKSSGLSAGEYPIKVTIKSNQAKSSEVVEFVFRVE